MCVCVCAGRMAAQSSHSVTCKRDMYSCVDLCCRADAADAHTRWVAASIKALSGPQHETQGS